MKYTVNIYLTKTIESVAELSHIGSHVIPAVFAPEGFTVENMQVSRQYDAPTMLGIAQAISAAETMTTPASTAVDQPVKRARTKKAEAAPAEVSHAVAEPEPEVAAEQHPELSTTTALETSSDSAESQATCAQSTASQPQDSAPASVEEATATIEEVRAYANLRIKGDASQGIEADNGFGAKVAEVLKNQFGVKALSDVADKTKPSPKFAQVLAALKEVK
ncbi:MAG TPA: hypothetical protein VFM48_07720 [Aquabacterium sp.]|nr:hypothetical protein [Aquabacterium sp.]